MIRRSAFAVGALLGSFHLWLFGQQAWSGQLADPATIGRWALGVALVAGLMLCRHRGIPVLGRQSVAIWVLAALLHGPALAADADRFSMAAVPEAATTIAHALLSVAGLGLLVAAALALTTRNSLPPALSWVPSALPPVSGERRAAVPRFLPRPPPVA
ncbi:MAG: hypothetical protein R2745_21345 [Vicinamibacterales bacterium]